MQVVPHVDVVESERINTILDNPANYVWRAIDCETLDTWTPDLGLTPYPVYSIYRAPGVANSGQFSTLRHRFWDTVYAQRNHVGTRYVGIVLYDAAQEECPIELRLGAEEIGRIEPARHDNRRHLIVAARPVEFIGEMEVFQLTAPGKGEYRIEAFVLLQHLPEPSRFVPTIHHIETTTAATPNGVKATLHFLTAQVAVTSICATAPGQPRQESQGDAHRVHTLILHNLAPDCLYQVTITATGKGGEQAQHTFTLSTQAPTPAQRPVTVPVSWSNQAAVDLAGLPLTFGVPLAQGQLFAPTDGQVVCDGVVTPAQVRIHAAWPDGSARWALVDTLAPPVAPAASVQGEVRLAAATTRNGTTVADDSQAGSVQVTSTHLRVGVRAGDLATAWRVEQAGGDGAWRLLPVSLACTVQLGNGLNLLSPRVEEVVLEETGPLRSVIRCAIPHTDQAGVAHLRSNLRLHLFAGQRFVKLVHRLEVISPHLPPAASGGPVAPDSPLASAVAGTQGEESTLLRLRTFTLQIAWPGVQTLQHGDEPPAMLKDGWRVCQTDDLGYQRWVAGQSEVRQGRLSGHVRVQGANGALDVGVRSFWQRYPKGLAVHPHGIDIEALPLLPAPPLPGDADAEHRLYFWLREGSYLLKAGMALTNEIMLAFDLASQEAARIAQWLQTPLLARPPIDYVNNTHALNPIAPKAGSRLPQYEALADQAIHSFLDDRAAVRAYGQLNFGDWYGESSWSWGNNEYDPAFCGYLEFLRGGDPRWAAWAAESARHLADVDTINFSNDDTQVGAQSMHIPGHLGGYLPPYFRSKMKGTTTLPSHTWVEGPALHYLLTGDETVRESLDRTRRWLTQDSWFDGYEFANCREVGWHLIHLCMLATALQDPRALLGAALLVERVLERQEPGGGWERNLTESHCGCGYPRCRGEAGFMVGVLLSGLQRYYFNTGDPRVAQAIVGGARWLIRRTYDSTSGYFRYTSCAARTVGGDYSYTQYILEGLANAYAISGDAEIGEYVQQGLESIGRFPQGLEHAGLGKAMSLQMRYVPSLLAALERQPTTRSGG